MKKYIAIICCLTVMTFCLTACGKDKDSTTEDSVVDDMTDAGDDAVDDAGEAVDDAVDGATNAVDDVTDDVTDAVDNAADDVSDAITGDYNTYDDAHDYFTGLLPDSGKNYNIKNTDKDLADFGSGMHGYHFELHNNKDDDTSKIGDFYVNVDNGKIYRVYDDGSAKEFDIKTLK